MSSLVAWNSRTNLGTVVQFSNNRFEFSVEPSRPQILQLKDGQLVASWLNISNSGEDTFQQARMLSSVGTTTKLTYTLTYTNGSPIRVEPFKNEPGMALSERQEGGFIGVIKDGTTVLLQEFNASGESIISNAVVATPASGSNDEYGPVDIASTSRLSSFVTYGELANRGNTLLQLTDMYHLYGRIYNPLINSYGAERSLFSERVENFSTHALPSGGYLVIAGQAHVVVSVAGLPSGERDESLVFSIFNSLGGPVVNARTIAESEPVNENFEVFNDYVATALPNSGFVVAYEVRNGENPGSYVFSNVVQVYNAAGSQVALARAAPGHLLAVSALPENQFILIYQKGAELRAQHFSATGTELSDTLIETSSKALRKQDVDIVGLEDGRIALNWVSSSGRLAVQIFDTRESYDGRINPKTLEQIGTPFDDVFTVGATAELAHGGAGNDTITQFAGTRTGGPALLNGGDGDDTIVMKGAFNSDLIEGGDGSDTIDWSGLTGVGGIFNLAAGTARGAGNTQVMKGFENLTGTASGDVITGTPGANSLIGLGGNDAITGGAGDDRLEGGAGDDILDGGPGNDTYDYRISSAKLLGSDVISDSAGSDVILIDSRAQIVSAQRLGNDLLLKLKQGDITIKDHFTTGQIESLTDKEKQVVLANGLVGGNLPGIIPGSEAGELMDGRGGDDLLYGAGGDDILLGSEGDDLLQGDGGDDRLDGGEGLDTAQYQNPFADYRVTATASHITVSDKVAGRDGLDELIGIERIAFTDGALALDRDGNAGKVYALYGALLGRDPDAAGLGYFLRYLDGGGTAQAIALAIWQSSELGQALPNAELITKLYAIWLHRTPEQDGFAHWMARLDGTDRAAVIAEFLAAPTVLQQATAAMPSDGLWFV